MFSTSLPLMLKDELLRKFAADSSVAFLIYSFGILFSFFSQLFFARVLGAETYGIYAYVMAWMAVLAYLSKLGFDTLLLRFLPLYHASKDWALARGAITYAQNRIVMISLIIVVGFAAYNYYYRQLNDADWYYSFQYGIFLIPIWALTWLNLSIIRANGGVISAVLPFQTIREGLLFIFAILIFLKGQSINSSTVVIVTVFVSLIAYSFSLIQRLRITNLNVKNSKAKFESIRWRHAAIPLFFISAAEILINKMGTLILGWSGDPVSAGIFAIIFNISLLLTLPRIAIDTLFAPQVSKLYAKNELKKLQNLTTYASILSFSVALTIGLCIVILAKPVLSYFGSDFLVGASSLIVLVIGQLIVAGAGSQLQILAMTGNQRISAQIILYCVVFGFITANIAVQYWGLFGVAVSTTASLFVWNLMMAIFLWKKLGLKPGIYGFFMKTAV